MFGVRRVKLLRVGPLGVECPAVLDESGQLHDLSGVTGDIHGAFFADGGLEWVRGAPTAGQPPRPRRRERTDAHVARPGKIICIGLNHSDDAAAMACAVGYTIANDVSERESQPERPYLRAGDVIEVATDGLSRRRQAVGQA
jgi:2-keto-4-pentenoate hydratase/2-oxohepta-3-ene-1,7-dioic acid hydratase in catechol pathway